mmetsp:Transcript_46903/g.116905  ORF Transcript_46903/g.116905 Transcript_46903/m.116905 type:complete len:270 (-) Transcript_46903:636-1445(-)
MDRGGVVLAGVLACEEASANGHGEEVVVQAGAAGRDVGVAASGTNVLPPFGPHEVGRLGHLDLFAVHLPQHLEALFLERVVVHGLTLLAQLSRQQCEDGRLWVAENKFEEPALLLAAVTYVPLGGGLVPPHLVEHKPHLVEQSDSQPVDGLGLPLRQRRLVRHRTVVLGPSGGRLRSVARAACGGGLDGLLEHAQRAGVYDKVELPNGLQLAALVQEHLVAHTADLPDGHTELDVDALSELLGDFLVAVLDHDVRAGVGRFIVGVPLLE